MATAVEPNSLHVSAAQGRRDLAAYAGTYSTLVDWKKRAENIRTGILRGANLDPLPSRNPLKPIRRGERKQKGYTVENVAFESVPGFFVTGSLYRPEKISGKHPAILCPHGHFGGENGGGRFRPDHQIRCATLARMGAITLAYDMVGWGDSTQMQHGQAATLTMQILNGMRAIDFLSTLDQVDPDRIGVTGASGGGTQTFLLAALDDRVTASVPVVMVAANYYGGCKCESGLPIHKSTTHDTNNAEIAALAAPRPQLLVSCGADWTQHTPEIELPYIRNVYRLHGHADLVENAHFPEQQHDYNRSKRLAVYRFLARHLGLDLEAVRGPGGEIHEMEIPIEPQEDLLVFSRQQPRPAHALQGATAVLESLRKLQNRPSGP
jgi:dienelactone hydrolase